MSVLISLPEIWEAEAVRPEAELWALPEGVEKFNLLSLFSGIGGFELGLERSGGFKTVAQCEIDPYCRAVLKKHWPDVPCYEDVRTLTADTLQRDGITVDAICGGFPCQDVSIAGKRAGIEAERSGLWAEYARIIGELRPAIAIVENTPGLLSLGMGRVLGDLAALRYDAVWDCLPAFAVGANHPRDRFWLVAYSHENNGNWWNSPLQMGRRSVACKAEKAHHAGRIKWGFEPGICRILHGVSNRVDRVGALGNAVVPQIPELIGRSILEALRNSHTGETSSRTHRTRKDETRLQQAAASAGGEG